MPPVPEEGDDPALGLEPGYVRVEVEAIHSIDCQGHVLRDNLGDVGHGLLRGLAISEGLPPNGRPWEAESFRALTDVAFTGRFEAKLR